MNKEQVLKLVKETEYQKIRAGETHRFIDTSIVVAEDRLFVRQYSFRKRSWYTAFLDDPNGAIKCGDTVIKVQGVVPTDLDEINPKINEAYLEKYGHAAQMMTGARHMASTMELIPVPGE